jgi:thymidine kinase
MMPSQIDDLFWVAVEQNIPVICYGLRTDFLLQSFPASERLLALAHTLEELKTICRCGKKAICNMRVIH